MTFKENHRELQELVRELTLIRKHNLKFKEGDSQETFLGFAEVGLCLIVLERFLRILPNVQITEKDTLPNLLERATSKKCGVLKFVDLNTGKPILDEQQRELCIEQITKARNTLLHGNYEQAALWAGCNSIEEYFKTQFMAEVEEIYQITDSLVKQINPNTGKPYEA